MPRAVLQLVVLLLMTSTGMQARSSEGTVVVVRTYNYAAVPPDELQKARRAAGDIFRSAGISLEWVDCRVPQNAGGAGCIEPLAARGDLILRLMDASVAQGARSMQVAQGAGSMQVAQGFSPVSSVAQGFRPAARPRTTAATLGVSMLDRGQHEGVLMTIDLFPIRSIAEQTSSNASTLLGRAVAHEIGHLLLGAADHSKVGLMRAHWSQDELRGVRPAHWQFSPREAAQMRRRLALRSGSAN